MGRSRFPGKPLKFQNRKRISVLSGTVYHETASESHPPARGNASHDFAGEQEEEEKKENNNEKETNKNSENKAPEELNNKEDNQDKSPSDPSKSPVRTRSQNKMEPTKGDKPKPVKKTVTFGTVESCEDIYFPLKKLPKHHAPLIPIIKKKSALKQTEYSTFNSILKPAKLTDLSSKSSLEHEGYQRKNLNPLSKPMNKFSQFSENRCMSPPPRNLSPVEKESNAKFVLPVRSAHSSRVIKPNKKFIDGEEQSTSSVTTGKVLKKPKLKRLVFNNLHDDDETPDEEDLDKYIIEKDKEKQLIKSSNLFKDKTSNSFSSLGGARKAVHDLFSFEKEPEYPPDENVNTESLDVKKESKEDRTGHAMRKLMDISDASSSSSTSSGSGSEESWDSESPEGSGDEEEKPLPTSPEKDKSSASQLLRGKVIIREARLQLATPAAPTGLDGPFTATSSSPTNTPPTTVTCGVCGAVRFYRFVKQARKFGIYSCESCRKFISKMLKKEKMSHKTGIVQMECLKGEGNCNVPPIVRSQHWKLLRCTNKTRCPACWLKMCLKAFQLPPNIRAGLTVMLPPYMRSGLKTTSSLTPTHPLRITSQTTQQSVFTLPTTDADNKIFGTLKPTKKPAEEIEKEKPSKERPVVTDEPKEDFSTSRKRQLTRIKVRKKDKSEKAEVKLTEDPKRQKVELKGPRVKHVCRSASIVLGQPIATFPTQEEKDKKVSLEPLESESTILPAVKDGEIPDLVSEPEVDENKPQVVPEPLVTKEPDVEASIENKKKKLEPLAPIKAQNKGESSEDETVMELVPRKPVSKPFTTYITNVRGRSQKCGQNRPELICVDFWESYDPDEVCSSGFGLIGAGPFTVAKLCFLCGSAGREKMLVCWSCCEWYHSWCAEESAGGGAWTCARCAACAACAAGERAPAAALRTCAALCAAPPDPVAAGDLAAALFAYTVVTPMPRDEAEAATWRECSAAWQQAAATLSATATQQLLREAALTLHTHLNLRSNLIKKSTVSETPENAENGGPEALQPGRMRHAVAQCAGLVRADTPPHARTLALSRHVLALAPAVRVEPFALRHDLVTSRLSCPCEDDDVTAAIGDDVTELDVRAYVEYARAAVFEAMYLRRILLLEPGRCDELLCDEYMVDRLCGVIYRHMVVCSLWEGYAFWPHYKLIEETKTTMDESLEAIIDECTIQIKGRLLNVLTERAESKGYYWAFARKYFEHKGKLKTEHTSGSGTHEENVESDKSVENENSESETNKETDDVGNFDVENISDIVTKNGFFHILQANVKGLGPADTLRARFVCMVRAVHVAHAVHAAHETDARFLTDTVRCWPDAGADVIVNAYYACNRIMLYDMDVSRSAWRTVCSNTATVQYLCALVDARGWDLPAHHWDFTTITLCSLLCSIDKSKEHWASTKVGMLARAALRLYRAVAVFVRALPAASSRRQPARHVAQLAAEWKDIFAPDTNHNLFSILLYILETVPATSTVTSTHVAVLHELVQCAAHLQWHLVPAGHRRSLSLDRLVSAACDVLRRPVPLAYKCLACAALRAIHEPLVLDDAERVAERTESSPPPALSLQRYAATYRALQDAVQAALAHVPVCESWCSLDAHSEVGGLALGWLLLARAVLQQCELARKDLHHHYIELYRELNYCEPVLVCALRLLPEDVFVFARDGGHGPAPRAEHLFNNEPDLDLYKHADAASVSAAACASVRAAVCGAGVTQARGWRAAAPHRHGNMLDTLVTTYISPYVIEEEFATLQRRAGELEDIDLYIRRSTRSVACVLTLEERALELGVTLARAHPLAPPALRAAAGPEPHTGWLAVYLAHQNGTLLNALKMWRGAVTSKVERSPQCYICYCRLHFQTGRLPQAYCRQCRNKFHTPCLRKWFNTSNKSNCPLCRTAF